MALTYFQILYEYKNLIRKRLWIKLNDFDRAFILSCLKLTKIKTIFNKEIINTFKDIIKKSNNFKKRMIEKGKSIIMKSINGKVAEIIPKLKDWFNDINYQFWLGLALSK